MALPTLEVPKYEAKIPSTGKKVLFRPYLVKEEKILMIAAESEDQNQVMQAVKDVIQACTFDKVDPDKLCSFDLEYLFLKLRSKSVGEISKVSIKCEKCQKPTSVEINLEEVEVNTSKTIESKIKLTNTIGVVMSYPTMKEALKFSSKTGDPTSKVDTALEVIISCIDSIYDDKKVYPADESTREELLAFVESLNQSQFAKIQEFIEAMPKLQHEVKFKCSNKECGCDNTLVLEGMSTFF